jgi:hypothetical protein
MAYFDQEKKRVVADNLKKVIPKGWKYTLSVRNHSTVVLTIQSAQVDLISEIVQVVNNQPRALAEPDRYAVDKVRGYWDVNPYWLETQFDGDLLKIFENIKTALKSADWYDNSDIQTDYFDTAYYFDICIGRWNKPFIHTEAA